MPSRHQIPDMKGARVNLEYIEKGRGFDCRDLELQYTACIQNRLIERKGRKNIGYNGEF